MTTSDAVVAQTGAATQSTPQSANLADILERVLDKGVVVAGDIRINLLDIELLTIKLRLLIVSVETARELGIDWWQHDPWLRSDERHLTEENERLRRRVEALESVNGRKAIEADSEVVDERRIPVHERADRRRRRA